MCKAHRTPLARAHVAGDVLADMKKVELFRVGEGKLELVDVDLEPRLNERRHGRHLF